MKTLNILAMVVLGVTVLGAGCIAPGSNQEIVRASYLPDHITEISGTTLPRALLEARQRGKSSVTITDVNGNILVADLSVSTSTTFTMTDPVEIEDPLKSLITYSVPVEKAYNVTRDNGLFQFTLNTVRHDDIASIMYEISVRLLGVGSTQNWVIDIR